MNQVRSTDPERVDACMGKEETSRPLPTQPFPLTPDLLFMAQKKKTGHSYLNLCRLEKNKQNETKKKKNLITEKAFPGAMTLKEQRNHS